MTDKRTEVKSNISIRRIELFNISLEVSRILCQARCTEQDLEILVPLIQETIKKRTKFIVKQLPPPS